MLQFSFCLVDPVFLSADPPLTYPTTSANPDIFVLAGTALAFYGWLHHHHHHQLGSLQACSSPSHCPVSRWTPLCRKFRKAPVCWAKLSPHSDIKNSTLDSTTLKYTGQKYRRDISVLSLWRASEIQMQVIFLRKTFYCDKGPSEPQGRVREGFDEFCERSTDSSLAGTFGKRMGHMQMACTVWRRSFPQAECEKGSPSPCRARWMGLFFCHWKCMR